MSRHSRRTGWTQQGLCADWSWLGSWWYNVFHIFLPSINCHTSSNALLKSDKCVTKSSDVICAFLSKLSSCSGVLLHVVMVRIRPALQLVLLLIAFLACWIWCVANYANGSFGSFDTSSCFLSHGVTVSVNLVSALIYLKCQLIPVSKTGLRIRCCKN